MKKKLPTLVLVAIGIAANLGIASPVHAAALSYGDFLGEFTGHPFPANVVEDALTPSPFATLDLHPLGAAAPIPFLGWVDIGQPEFSVTFTNSSGKKIGGTWEYEGFPSWLAPGQNNIQMFLALKYSSYYSVFHYGDVAVNDTGVFSTSPWDTGAPMHSGANGKPYELSYIKAYWAEVPAPVPVPPALLLLASGVGALVGLRRRLRIAGPAAAV